MPHPKLHAQLQRVLLTDAISPRTLAVCRSLGRHGVSVTCTDDTFLNLVFFSRYCHTRRRCPSPRKASPAFVASLLEYLEAHPQDCIIPMKDETLDVVLANRREFECLTRVPFAENRVFQVFRDKGKTLRIAELAGVPYPRTVIPEAPNQVLEAACALKFPLAIKPRLNSGGLGLCFVQNERELLDAFSRIHAQYPYPLIQEAIPPGEKYSVCCLFDENSQPVATFVQRQLRSFPPRIGASTVQQSVCRPDLTVLAVSLLEKAGWYGIAEVEFIIDPRDDTPLLMEVNPRFWSSVQMAVQAGVDFPYLFYQLACGERFEPVHQYRVGEVCRQVLPYDMMHFLASPNRFHLQPSFFSGLNPRGGHTLFAGDDPGPVLGLLLAAGRRAFDPEMWRHLARIETVANLLASRSDRRSPARLKVPMPRGGGWQGR